MEIVGYFYRGEDLSVKPFYYSRTVLFPESEIVRATGAHCLLFYKVALKQTNTNAQTEMCQELLNHTTVFVCVKIKQSNLKGNNYNIDMYHINTFKWIFIQFK